MDIRTVCESIVILLPNQDEESEVELMVIVKPEVPRLLYLDETYLHRIIMNLLSNSMKFTHSGYVSLTIGMQDSAVIAAVRDTGCGIPSSFLPELFKPFRQAQGRVGSQRGTGLGLSIIKQLLSRLGGTIAVESKNSEDETVRPEESGSIFTINIPVGDSSASDHLPNTLTEIPTVAIFTTETPRYLEGLQDAWREFGWKTIIIDSLNDLSSLNIKYIWASISYLDRNTAVLHYLLECTNHIVLVPYDFQISL